MNWNFVPINF